jgi:CRISPR-associated protein Csy1
MHSNVTAFLSERKAIWLKAKLKSSLSPDEEKIIRQEAEEKFSLAAWLPDAARRAPWLSIVSHPSKFSHPSAKTTPIIAYGQRTNDGYLRTGNLEYEQDVFGNAAAMDVYTFLCLKMDDGQTVLNHLEQDSGTIKTLFNIPSANYDNLKTGFMSVKQTESGNKTDRLVKQVYFPVETNYHLLSILTPSGVITQVKKRIDAMRFSDATKQAKEARKKNEIHAEGYDDILELTVTAYGGTQPQNISVLNSQNAGRAFLLMSTPPVLQQRRIRLPRTNFFRNTLSAKHFQDSFQSLDKLIKTGVNNLHIREGIGNTLKYIVEKVLQQAFRVRAMEVGWSNKEYYQGLPLAQRIWLDDANLEQRESQDDWLEDIVHEFARWLLNNYEYLFKETYVKLSDDEFREVKSIVEQALSNDQEFFR